MLCNVLDKGRSFDTFPLGSTFKLFCSVSKFKVSIVRCLGNDIEALSFAFVCGPKLNINQTECSSSVLTVILFHFLQPTLSQKGMDDIRTKNIDLKLWRQPLDKNLALSGRVR